MGLLKQLAIYPSAISTGTSCHQGKNTHGHRVALAQPLALTAVVSPSIQARWRVVRGMRRLQSAGAVCCLAISTRSRCGSALSVTCDLWQCQHWPCRALQACGRWWQQCDRPQPLQPWGLHGCKRAMNCLVPGALFSDVVALSCCVPYPSLLGLCFSKWGTRCFQFPLTETLPQLWAGSWTVRLNLFQ